MFREAAALVPRLGSLVKLDLVRPSRHTCCHVQHQVPHPSAVFANMSLCHQVERHLALQVCDMPMNAKNKYFDSSWRRNDAHCPGGFMMESSVHFLAALRMLAAAGGA